jgi:hypothetical protein
MGHTTAAKRKDKNGDTGGSRTEMRRDDTQWVRTQIRICLKHKIQKELNERVVCVCVSVYAHRNFVQQNRQQATAASGADEQRGQWGAADSD